MRGLLGGQGSRRSALVVLAVGALLSGCGGSDDPEPKAEAVEPATKHSAPPTAGRESPQPTGPSQPELALRYQKRVLRFHRKYRSQRRTLIKGFKNAKTPAAYIAVAKKYKRFLNKSAHNLSVMKPPRRIRRYHHRLIVIVRRINGHMSLAIGGLRQLSLKKLQRFEMLIDRDIDKGDKAADTIDDRMSRLLRTPGADVETQ